MSASGGVTAGVAASMLAPTMATPTATHGWDVTFCKAVLFR